MGVNMIGVRKWLSLNWNKYGKDELIQRCIRELLAYPRSVKDMYTRIKNGKVEMHHANNKEENSMVSGIMKIEKNVGFSTIDMQKKYDAEFKIEEAIKQIPKGRFVPEAEFRDVLVKANMSHFRIKSNLEKFDKYKGKAKSIIYWGNADDIESLKLRGILK
jgi:hypothetical protein